MALGVMGLRHMAGGELVAASCCRVVASAPWVAATPPPKKIYILKPQKQTHPTKKPRGWKELLRGWGWPSESRWGAGPQSSERDVMKPFGLLSSCFCNSRFLHGARLCKAEHAHESRNCAPKHSQNQGMGR